MKNEKARLGCVIMASGLGRRFGGNKLTAPFLGEAMVLRILHATDGLFDRRIVVTRHGDVAQICRERDIAAILHDLPHRSDTVRLGLQAIREGLDGCMFCPGDQPLVSRESLQQLMGAFCRERECIHRLGGGMPVIFPAWAFDALENLPRGLGGGYVIAQHPACLRSTEPLVPEELLDADTPEMLRKLEVYAKQQS